MGIIALGQGVAVNVLKRVGIEPVGLRNEIEEQIGTGPKVDQIGHTPYTPRVQKVLALAAKEAQALHHPYVGTEHFLLGLLREGDNVAAHVLKSRGLDFERARQEILKELSPE